MAPYLPLILFAVVSTLTPGAATTLATASGAHFGFRRSVPLMAGAALGLASMAATAAAGLASVLLAWPSLRLAMKITGTAYLLWLALRIARSGAPRARETDRPTSLIGGLLVLWQNPKAWTMTMGAAASFSTLASGPTHMALILGPTFGATASASLVIWCLTGRMLARVLRSDAEWRALNITLGVLLVLSIIPMWLD